MNIIKIVTIIIITTALALMATGAIIAKEEIDKINQTNQQITNTIQNQFETLTATYQNPKITIKTETTQAFIEKANQINSTIIYNTNTGFIAIDNNFEYAYTLQLQTPIPSILSLMLIIIGLGIFVITGYSYLMFGDW